MSENRFAICDWCVGSQGSCGFIVAALLLHQTISVECLRARKTHIHFGCFEKNALRFANWFVSVRPQRACSCSIIVPTLKYPFNTKFESPLYPHCVTPDLIFFQTIFSNVLRVVNKCQPFLGDYNVRSHETVLQPDNSVKAQPTDRAVGMAFPDASWRGLLCRCHSDSLTGSFRSVSVTLANSC